jgi:alkaline phosphatase D
MCTLARRARLPRWDRAYVVAADTFELYAALLYARSNGASEEVLGRAQEQWLTDLLAASAGTRWTLVGSSVSMTQMVLDLRMVSVLPEAQRARLLFSADQWDGFPNKKRQLLTQMAASNGGRVVCLAGDIHASFASLERPAMTGPPCQAFPA